MAGISVHEAEIMAREDYNKMRKEYSHMREVANKRIERLGRNFPNAKAYQNNSKGFATLEKVGKRNLPKAYSELSKFMGAKTSTVHGQQAVKRKTIATWREQGLNLNSKNYDKAMKILEEARRQKLVYGSDKVVEAADAMLMLNDSETDTFLDNLGKMLEHSDELQNTFTAMKQVEGYSFEDVVKALGK